MHAPIRHRRVSSGVLRPLRRAAVIMILLKPGDVCSIPDCGAPAVCIAAGRGNKLFPGHPSPAVYCKEHGETIEDEGEPEFPAMCPNCGCHFGVN